MLEKLRVDKDKGSEGCRRAKARENQLTII